MVICSPCFDSSAASNAVISRSLRQRRRGVGRAIRRRPRWLCRFPRGRCSSRRFPRGRSSYCSASSRCSVRVPPGSLSIREPFAVQSPLGLLSATFPRVVVVAPFPWGRRSSRCHHTGVIEQREKEKKRSAVMIVFCSRPFSIGERTAWFIMCCSRVRYRP